MALNKQSAVDAGNILDKAADLIQKNAVAFGISTDIAHKFAYQCDLLSDHIAKKAGFDPQEIGKEKGGPAEKAGDEPYMNQEFSQQENRELRERQQKGELGSGVSTTDPQTPTPGVQASLDLGVKLADTFKSLHQASTKMASSEAPEVKALGTKLAGLAQNVVLFQGRVLQGGETGESAQVLIQASGHIIPHLASDIDPATAIKLACMVDVVGRLAAETPFAA